MTNVLYITQATTLDETTEGDSILLDIIAPVGFVIVSARLFVDGEGGAYDGVTLGEVRLSPYEVTGAVSFTELGEGQTADVALRAIAVFGDVTEVVSEYTGVGNH